MTLHEILEAFAAPVNEEQAWGICYQCAKCLQQKWQDSPKDCFPFTGINNVELTKDGNVNFLPGTSIVGKYRFY